MHLSSTPVQSAGATKYCFPYIMPKVIAAAESTPTTLEYS